MDTITTLLPLFGLSQPLEIKPLGSGLINVAWYVETTEGHFVLQKMNPMFTENTCDDAKKICEYASAHSIGVPTYLSTTNGKSCATIEGAVYRMMKKIEGDTYSTVTHPDQAYSAARLMGKFHHALKSFDYKCRGSLPHYHDMDFYFDAFKKNIAGLQFKERLSKVTNEANQITKEVPLQKMPADFPRQIVHGDLKISNFLFNNNEAIAILDFDTCMTDSPLIDVGDALRSWTNKAEKDNPEAIFDSNIYETTIAGYIEAAPLSDREKKYIPQSFRRMVIQQAMRFLNDYFEDTYYGWNPAKFSSRREHNLARTKNQLSLYEQIKRL